MARITITNELHNAPGGDVAGIAARAGAPGGQSAPHPYRTRFVPLEGPTQDQGGAIILPHNPDRYSVRGASRWAVRDAVGVSRPSSDWEGSEPRSLSFEYLAGLPAHAPQEIELLIATFETWRDSLLELTQEPTLVNVQMGAFSLIAHLTEFEAERQMVDAQGRATRALLTFTWTENDPSK